MREAEFRYHLKNIHTNEIHFKWYHLCEIEKKGLHGLFDIQNYEIIHRNKYTGLKDKNGKEIYENDIVKYHKGKYIVEWSSASFEIVDARSYNDEFEADYYYFHRDGVNSLKLSEVAIIGNIHKNPELM